MPVASSPPSSAVAAAAALLLAAAALAPRASAQSPPLATGFAQAGFSWTRTNNAATFRGPTALPAVVWQRPLAGAAGLQLGSALALSPTALYVSSYGGTAGALYALGLGAAASGATSWSYAAAASAGGAPAIAADGSVLFASDNGGRLTKLSAAGAPLWTFAAGGAATTGLVAPVIGPDGAVYYGTLGAAGMLFKFVSGLSAGGNGAPVWNITVQNLAGSPTLSPSGDAVYIVSSGAAGKPFMSTVFKFAAATGALLWTSVLSTSDTDLSVGIAADPSGGAVYANSDSHLHSLNASTGVQIFDVKLPIGAKVAGANGRTAMTPCILPSGVVAFGDSAGVSAVTPGTGATAWTYATPGAVSAVPVVDAMGNLFFGDAKGNVFGLSPAGALLWTLALPGGASKIWASGALGSDGTLYFAASAPAPAVFALSSFVSPSPAPSGAVAASGTPVASASGAPAASSVPLPSGVVPSASATPTPAASLGPSVSPAASGPVDGAIAGGSGSGGGAVAGLSVGSIAGGAVGVIAAVVVAVLVLRRSGGSSGSSGGGGKGGLHQSKTRFETVGSDSVEVVQSPLGGSGGLVDGWTECRDAASGRVWFHQHSTGRTEWTLPLGAVLTGRMAK